MTNLKVLFFLFFAYPTMAVAYKAHEGNINAIWGMQISRTDTDSVSEIPSVPIYGDVGLIVQGDINHLGSLEIGLFHMHKAYFRQDNFNVLAEKANLVHITMGYRRWTHPFFAPGLSFSSSYPMRKAQIIYRSSDPNIFTDTSARDTVDYGFDFSIQSELWKNSNWAVLSDVRYHLSVTAKDFEKANHYALILGLKYLIQGNLPHQKNLK